MSCHVMSLRNNDMRWLVGWSAYEMKSLEQIHSTLETASPKSESD
jgi:hypothetical protein